MSNTKNPYPGIRLEWRCITPAYAAKLLKGNTGNRRLRTSWVAQYAIDIAAGDWGFSESAIVIADDGTITNGQHRLQAVVSSRHEIWSIIVRNVPRSAIGDFDQGRGRSIVDAINLANPDSKWKATTRIVGCARWMMFGDVPRSNTHHTVYAYIERHLDAILFANTVFRSAGVRGITKAPVLASVARAFENGEDSDRLTAFADVLLTGESNGAKDSAAIKLRNWLIGSETKDVKDRPTRTSQYSKAQRALAAFLAGERINRLYEAPAELWPLDSDE